MQAKRPDSTPVEAHYLAKSWMDRQRLVSRGSMKGEYTIVMNPFAVQRNSIRQEYFSNFRDNSAISERIQHHLTQLLSNLPNESYILPPAGYGDALVDCSDEKKGCRPSASDASSRDVISPNASANVSVNGVDISVKPGAGSSRVGTTGGLGVGNLPNQGNTSIKRQETQDGNDSSKHRISGALPSSSLTSVGQDLNWPLNGRREDTPTTKVHSPSPDPVLMLETGPAGAADARVLHSTGRGEASTSTVTAAASSICGPEKQGQDCDCSAETMPNRNLAYLLNSKHVRLELDEIPPYTPPTPASFQQAMTSQDDCGSITERNQLAEKCTGGVCGGSTCIDLSTKKENVLAVNVSGHLNSNSRSESPAGVSVGSTAAPGPTSTNIPSPVRRSPTFVGEPQAKRPRTDPSLKIEQVGTTFAAGWCGTSGSEPKDRGIQYPSWKLASLPERPLSALGRALGGTVRSSTPIDNQGNVQKDNSPSKTAFTHGPASSSGVGSVKTGGSRAAEYHQAPFDVAPPMKGSDNVGTNMSMVERIGNTQNNGARLGQQLAYQGSAMGKIEERKDDSVSGNLGSARGAPIVEGSTSDGMDSRVESDGNVDTNKDLKMNLNLNMSLNVNVNSHHSKSAEQPACDGAKGGGSGGVCAKRSLGLQCDICGVTFAKRGNKMRHIATVHDRLKQFQCDYCGMKFGLKADLTRHRVRIHESRAFSCTKCSKSFAEESQLVMHMRVTHEENTKPWECATCHIRFGRKSSLTRHEQTVHQQTRFACSICKKTYSQRFDAIRHARKVHGVANADKNGCFVLQQ